MQPRFGITKFKMAAPFMSRFSPALNSRFLQRIALQTRQHVRARSTAQMNTVILFVPQQEAWVIERFGKYYRILEPGLNFLVPLIDRIKYVQSLKEIAIDIPHQSAITVDNVTLQIDGVLYLRVQDPFKASYGVEDAEYAITQIAQTTMRAEIGKIEMDTVFRDRELLNVSIVQAINLAAEAWGIICLRYEIRDIKLPGRIQEAMQMQVEAERKKRAAVLESEGIREAAINVAEGDKRSRVLASEAIQMEKINQARGEADALLAIAKAQSESLKVVADAISYKNGQNAVSLNVAEKYISAFGKLAKEGNTVLLPASTGDVSSMVAQAMSIYKAVSPNAGTTSPNGDEHDSTPAESNMKEQQS